MSVVERIETGEPALPIVLPKRRRKPVKPGRVLRYVTLIVLSIVFVAPMAYMVTASFQPLSRMFQNPPEWIPLHPTLDNYIGFFQSDRPIYRWFFNSVFVSGTVTASSLFVSSLVAYTFAKRKFPGRDLLFFVGLAVLMLPGEVLQIPQYLILRFMPLFGGNNVNGVGGHGMLDSYLGLIVPSLGGSAFSVFLLRQYMKSAVPDELIDAARVDGAGHFRIYWKVVMPLCKPAVAALAIFTFQVIWQDLYGPLIIINSSQLYTLPLGLALFVQGNRTVWNLVMAGSVLATLPMVVVFAIFQKQFVRGISLSGSGVKG
jgi:multiple sugar transport system permease protein